MSNPMNQAQLEELLVAERNVQELVAGDSSGGEFVQQNSASGNTVRETIEVDPPDLEGVDPAKLSKVSVEIDMSRSSNYNKVAITLWASTPCKAGDEAAQTDRLVQVLHDKSREYLDENGLPLLRSWAQGG